MSALAIDQATSMEAAQPTKLREPKKSADDDGGFHGELKTAQKKPAARPEPAKKPTAKQAQPAGVPDGQATLDPQAASPGQPAVASKPVAEDVVAMISAGKSLVAGVTGNVAAVAAQVADGVAVDEAPALQATNAVTNPSDALPLTPLEQAVHDVLERLHDDSDKAPDHEDRQPHQDLPLPGITSMSATVEDAPVNKPDGPQPLREPTPVEQMQNANPSHVHLVIDDGERLVVTVAVRGDQVMTHIRADNQETANAFARNAGVLDDAMRARGLNLAELHTSHDQSPRERQQTPRQQQERERAQPRFHLEENL